MLNKKKEVAEGQLTEELLQQFYETGVAGPFNSPLKEQELDAMFNKLMDEIKSKKDHPLYGRFSVRDWHLIYPELGELIKHKAVSSKLQQILGEDLVLWRSKLFHKRSGDGPIEWHQEWGAFNGEEIGNDKPSLRPQEKGHDSFWNLTIWLALHDIPEELGAMQFVKGSYKKRYSIDMVPMVESAFWQDPFIGIETKQELIKKCKQSKLVLDIDSSKFLNEVNTDALDLEQLKQLILDKFNELKAAYTCDFDIAPEDLLTIPMKKGQYVIFPERTMHRSIANTSDSDRLAINFRVTRSDVLVYPARLENDFIDGSNLNIKKHKNVLVSGEILENRNEY